MSKKLVFKSKNGTMYLVCKVEHTSNMSGSRCKYCFRNTNYSMKTITIICAEIQRQCGGCVGLYFKLLKVKNP